jgi:hypothetical protein
MRVTSWTIIRTQRSVFYQNDDFGKDYLIGLKDGLGSLKGREHDRGRISL